MRFSSPRRRRRRSTSTPERLSLTRFAQQKRPLTETPARIAAEEDVPSKKQAKSERKFPRTSASPRHIEDSSSMEEGGNRGHLTSECTKSAKARLRCANCSGPHPANFSGLPQKPNQHQNNKIKSGEKRLEKERAAARKQTTNTSKPSFAEVVKVHQTIHWMPKK
ncbi:hypothetical protein TNCV_3623291 [Trichonephila clavipes]|nr:hypothetical protein TNCV_3623291 [Trichonephila clavipes]